MNSSAAKPPEQQGEVKLLFLLSLLAAIHAFVFTTAFPFFNQVDEQLHFDLAVRYSQGEIPRGLEPLAPESIRYITLFSSRAYLVDPANLVEGKLPTPLWRQPLEQALPQISERAAQWHNIVSTESTMPPLYYSVAGSWWRLGKAIGITNARLLYWLRFLNIPLLMCIVWLGWFCARKIFPDNVFARLAVPVLIAFMPQTAFYSINNDILAPLTFGLAFLAWLKFKEAETPTVRLAAGLGLTLAATFLTKISALPALMVALIFIGWRMIQMARAGKWRSAIPAWVMLAVCALLPVLTWMFWCKSHYGDYTGSAVKIAKLGWTHQPITEWLHHPLFTLRGLWIFVGDNFSTFWQGELLWMRQPLALPALDAAYKVLTLALIALGVVLLCRRPPGIGSGGLWFAVACLVATLGFFALLSVKFDFQDCFYPSRAHPYFTSGRLFLAILIPVMCLFAGGLDFALKRFSLRTKFTLLGLMVAAMLAGEIIVDARVFGCEYNWYHL